MRVVPPADTVTGVVVVTANADVSLDTMLLMVSDEPVVFLASTLSVLLVEVRTSPNDSDEGSNARPVVR